MAGSPISIGDLFAMAKVAQTLKEYGWGKYSNAGKFTSLAVRGLELRERMACCVGMGPEARAFWGAWLTDFPPPS